jgi:hypothetical protein
MAKIRAESKEMESKRIIKLIYETKSCFFEKINKIGKLLAKPSNSKEKKTQIIKMRVENRILQQIRTKFRGSLGNSLKFYIPID